MTDQILKNAFGVASVKALDEIVKKTGGDESRIKVLFFVYDKEADDAGEEAFAHINTMPQDVLTRLYRSLAVDIERLEESA